MINSGILQESCVVDNGEYFFDDDFNVPFDANLRQDPPASSMRKGAARSCRDLSMYQDENERNILNDNYLSVEARMAHANSDTCLNVIANSQHSVNVRAPEGFEDDYQEGTDLESSLLSDKMLFSQCSFLVANSMYNSSQMTSSEMEVSIAEKSKRMLNSNYAKHNYYMTYGGNNLNDLNRSSFYGDTNVSSWALKAERKAAVKTTNELEDVESRAKRPPVGPQMTSWGKKRHKTSLDNAGNSQSSNGRSLPSTGHHLLDVYSAQRGIELINTPADNHNRQEVQSTLPDEKKASTNIRKVHSFSLRSKPQKYIQKAPTPSPAYPGMGHISLPKSSKLEETAFLSKTLPDLSFLGNFIHEKPHTTFTHKRSHRGKSSERGVVCDTASSSLTSSKEDRQHNASLNFMSRVRRGSEPAVSCQRCGQPDSSDCRRHGHNNQSVHVVPNVNVADSNISMDISVHDVGESVIPNSQLAMKKSNSAVQLSGMQSHLGSSTAPALKPCLIRRNSSGIGADSFHDFSYALDRTISMPNAINDSGGSYAESSCDEDYEENAHYVKKSVSFSDRNQLAALEASYASSEMWNAGDSNIPRNLGVYGQDTLIAEFPLFTQDRRQNARPGIHLDVASRIQALAQDVIVSIEGMRSAHASATALLYEKPEVSDTANESGEGKSNTAFLPSGSHAILLQSAAEFVPAIYRLIADGLAPSSKQLLSKKPQTRVWIFIEESCRAGSSNRLLADALNETKSYTFLNTDHAKLKAFIFICLNYKALHIWWRFVCNNENLLKRFFAADAFMRLIKSPDNSVTLEDLVESLESLLHIPFALPILRDNGAILSDARLAVNNNRLNSPKRPIYMPRSPSTQSNARASSASTRKVSAAMALPPSLANKFRSRTGFTPGSVNAPVTSARSRPNTAANRVQRSHSARLPPKSTSEAAFFAPPTSGRRSPNYSALSKVPADCRIPVSSEGRPKPN